MLSLLWNLFITFLRIGFVGFGGGYAMMSLIMSETEALGITLVQFADLNALDMVIPGPIMINAATYVGYLNSGFWGSLTATIAVSIPSFVLVTLVMHFTERYRKSTLMNDVLSGIKPAAVGLIAAAAMSIGVAVMFPDGDVRNFFTNAMSLAAILPIVIFLATAIFNIRFKVNPIMLTIAAGILGAFLLG